METKPSRANFSHGNCRLCEERGHIFWALDDRGVSVQVCLCASHREAMPFCSLALQAKKGVVAAKTFYPI